MAEKRKGRKKKEEVDDKPTKEEYSIAKYLRNHLPVKKTTLLSHKVEYFTASKAIDCLLDSQWSTSKKKDTGIFNSRDSVVDYMNTMLIHKFFHRARKITVSKKEKDLKQKKKKNDRDEESSHAEETKEKKSGKKGKDKEQEKAKEDEKKDSGTDGGKEKKKEKRKIKLDMHLEQVFVDGNEAYVWIYDPVPTTAWLIGGLLVVGSILLCLFPLWPSSVRKGVYYISIGAAGFLCVIVALIIARIVVFSIIWVVTIGRHHLWILPNLTEDVGFFESFWPLYKYEYKGPEGDDEKKKKKKDKDSDDEEPEEGKKSSEEAEKDNTNAERESEHDAPTDTDRDSEESGEQTARRDSSTINGDNGFEIVSPDEVENDGDSQPRSRKVKTSAS